MRDTEESLTAERSLRDRRGSIPRPLRPDHGRRHRHVQDDLPPGDPSLGVHCIGTHATELIHIGQAVITWGDLDYFSTRCSTTRRCRGLQDRRPQRRESTSPRPTDHRDGPSNEEPVMRCSRTRRSSSVPIPGRPSGPRRRADRRRSPLDFDGRPTGEQDAEILAHLPSPLRSAGSRPHHRGPRHRRAGGPCRRPSSPLRSGPQFASGVWSASAMRRLNRPRPGSCRDPGRSRCGCRCPAAPAVGHRLIGGRNRSMSATGEFVIRRSGSDRRPVEHLPHPSGIVRPHHDPRRRPGDRHEQVAP